MDSNGSIELGATFSEQNQGQIKEHLQLLKWRDLAGFQTCYISVLCASPLTLFTPF